MRRGVGGTVLVFEPPDRVREDEANDAEVVVRPDAADVAGAEFRGRDGREVVDAHRAGGVGAARCEGLRRHAQRGGEGFEELQDQGAGAREKGFHERLEGGEFGGGGPFVGELGV